MIDLSTNEERKPWIRDDVHWARVKVFTIVCADDLSVRVLGETLRLGVRARGCSMNRFDDE